MNVPETPVGMSVRLVCPECRQALQVEYEVTSQLITSTAMDGITEKLLRPQFRGQKIAHTCNQTTIDDLLVDRETGEVLA